MLSWRPTPQHDVEECLRELLVQGIIVPLNVYIWLTPRYALTFLDFLLQPILALFLLAWLNQPRVVKKVDFLGLRLENLAFHHLIIICWEATLVHVGGQRHVVSIMVTA